MMDFFRSLGQRVRDRRQRDRESGVALLVTIAALSMLIALVAEFSYDTSVDLAQATGARDELRAHYLARASVSLSRMVIKIQVKFVEPIMAQAQQFLAQALPGGAGMALSLRVTDYAAPLMGFFGGSKDEVKLLGGLVGIDTEGVKGLGLESGKMDASIIAEDGKIDINCGSGSAPNRQRQLKVFRMLSALVYSPRYSRLFSEANSEGQFIERADLARGLIDWADGDELMFSLDANAGGGEDYKYDARRDPYRAHNNSYDTIEEVGLVRGMDANFMEAFASHLTVYASDPRMDCRVNLATVKGDCTPLLVGLVRAAAMADPTKPPVDPTILDDNRLYPLCGILCERGTAVGFDSLKTITAVLSNPSASISREDPRYQLMQSMRGVNITEAELGQVAYIGPPRVYRIVATGEAGKVKKKITAIVDTARTLDNPLTRNPQAERAAGVLQYWREE